MLTKSAVAVLRDWETNFCHSGSDEVVDRPALQAILKVRSIDRMKDKKRSPEPFGNESNQTKAEREKLLS